MLMNYILRFALLILFIVYFISAHECSKSLSSLFSLCLCLCLCLSLALSQWHDKDSSTSEGISIENIMLQFGLHQIINEPIHTLENSFSCIDLIFTLQPIYQSSSELSPHSTLTVTIRLFTPHLILKSFIHHLTLGRFSTIKIQMLILSDDPLMNLTGIELLQITM